MKTKLALGYSTQNGVEHMDLAVTLATYRIDDENHVTTTSLQIAQHFGKRHKDVLRAIKNLECSTAFAERNFALSIQMVEGGKNSLRKEPLYHITRDGFAFLAMGFTGKEAARWKETYLETFNAMEKALRTHYVEPLIEDKQFRKGIPLKFKLIMQEQGVRLRQKLRTEPDRSERVALYWSLFQVNSSLGVPTESMAVLVGEAPSTLARLEGGAP